MKPARKIYIVKTYIAPFAQNTLAVYCLGRVINNAQVIPGPDQAENFTDLSTGQVTILFTAFKI